MDNESLNLDRLRLVDAQPIHKAADHSVYKTKPGEMFLRGPIPWPWLKKASSCSGKALHVALQLSFERGLKKSAFVALNLSRMIENGVSRDAARRGLHELELAGLVVVERSAGRKPRVTILY